MSFAKRIQAHRLYKFASKTGLVSLNPPHIAWHNIALYEPNKDKIFDFLTAIGYDEDRTASIFIDEFPDVDDVKEFFINESRDRGFRGPTSFKKMAERFIRRYNVNVTVTLEKRKSTQAPWIQEQPKKFEAIQTDTKSQDEDVGRLLERYMDGRPEDYIRISEVIVKENKEEKKAYEWHDVPLQKAQNVQIHWADIKGDEVFDQNFSKDGKCVYDFLTSLITPKTPDGSRYRKVLGKTVEKIKEDLEDIVSRHRPPSLPFNEGILLGSSHPPEEGVTADELFKYCKDKELGCYLIDFDRNVRYAYTSPDKRLRPIIGMCNYGHFYPIKSKPYRKSIAESAKANNKGLGGKMFYKSIREQNGHNKSFNNIQILEKETSLIDNPKGLYIYKSSEDILHQFIHFLITHNTSYKNTSNSKGITSIKHKDWCFYLNPKIDDVKQFIEIKSGTESLYQVYKPILDSLNINEHNYYSTFATKQLNDHLTQNLVKSAYNYRGSITKDDLINNKIVTVDKNKAYSYILRNLDKILMASPVDVPINFTQQTHLHEDNIYYVKSVPRHTLGNILIDKEGWYINSIVKEALENNYINREDIILVMKCNNSMVNPFPKVVDTLYEKYGNDAKLLVNSYIGTFGRTHTDVGYMYVNNSFDKIIKHDKKQILEKYQVTKVDKIYDYYMTIVPKTIPRYKHGLLIYSQIVQSNRLLIYKMALKMNGEIKQITTDSITVSNPVFIPKDDPNDFDGWKHEETKTQQATGSYTMKKIVKPYEKNPKIQTVKFVDEWNTSKCVKQILSHNENVMVTGMAGSGKSHIIKKLLEQSPNQTVIVCPTHVAKSNFSRAETLHSFLCIDAEGNKTSKRCYKHLKYLILDEISMIGEELMKNLLSVLHQYSNIKVFAFGDFEQLKAVNDKSGSFLWKHLCKFHYRLEHNKRTANADDIEYFNVMKNARESQSLGYNFKNETSPLEGYDLNLCYTNEKRQSINSYYMNKYKPNNALYFERKNEDTIFQSMYIYEGLPLLIKKNMLDKNLYNGFRLMVTGVDEKNKEISMVCHQTKETHKFSFAQIKTSCVPCYALTIHTAQGQTFNESYTIHEYTKLDHRLLYVALSRARRLTQISINNY